MAVELVNLTEGFNRHVQVYAHDFPGHGRTSKNPGSTYNTVTLSIPSNLSDGEFVVSIESTGVRPKFSIDSSSEPTLRAYDNMLVYDANAIAGKELSFRAVSGVISYSDTGGGDNSYTVYYTNTSKVRAYFTGYVGEESIIIPAVIPDTGISISILNEQLRRDSNSPFSMDEPLSRLLAKKPTGLISFEDYKGKRLAECRRSEIYYTSGGGYGSGTSYSAWTEYTNNNDGFGIIYGLDVFLQAAVIEGNADALGIYIHIANKADPTKFISLQSSYGSGGNSTGTYTFNRKLTEEEIATLGGPNTELVWQVRLMGNTGGSTLSTRCLMVLTPETY